MKKEENAGIPVELAEQMVEAYSKESLEAGTGCYTKAVWYPFEQIERLYNTMKAQQADGLRVYYARYTKVAAEGMPEGYVGRNTLIFVPTKPGTGYGNEIHEDDLSVNPENKGMLCPHECGGTLL